MQSPSKSISEDECGFVSFRGPDFLERQPSVSSITFIDDSKSRR